MTTLYVEAARIAAPVQALLSRPWTITPTMNRLDIWDREEATWRPIDPTTPGLHAVRMAHLDQLLQDLSSRLC